MAERRKAKDLSEEQLSSLDSIREFVSYNLRLSGTSGSLEALSGVLASLKVLFKRVNSHGVITIASLGQIMVQQGLIPQVHAILSTEDDCERVILEEPLFDILVTYRFLLTRFSDKSAGVCQAICEQGELQRLVTELRFPRLSSDKVTRETDLLGKQDKTFRLVNLNMAVVYNVLRVFNQSRTLFRSLEGVELAQSFLNCAVNRISSKALLIIAFAADLECNPELLENTTDKLPYILHKLLDPALEAREEGKQIDIGFNADEIFHCLSILTRNESNARKFAELDGLGRVEKMMSVSDKTTDEVLYSLETIWNLCFIDRVKEKVAEREALVAKCLEQKGAECAAVRRAAGGIDMELNPRHENGNSGGESGGQVMISYNWGNQPLALQLRDELRKDGFTIWMDVEKMEGDMLEKMAEAVEISSVIICCVSETYRDSQPCRSEASYAYKLGKPVIFVMVEPGFKPSGWLGVFMGMNLYYRLADEFHPQYEKMLDRVRGALGISETARCERSHSKVSDRKGSDWTENDLRDWWDKAAPGVRMPEALDRSLLEELKKWQQDMPAQFRSVLINDLSIVELVAQLRFSSALRKL